MTAKKRRRTRQTAAERARSEVFARFLYVVSKRDGDAVYLIAEADLQGVDAGAGELVAVYERVALRRMVVPPRELK